MNNNEIEIDLLSLIQAVWKKALVIILVAIIMASLFFAGTLLLITPTYDATVSMYVNNSSFSFGLERFSISASEASASNYLVNSYVFILKSRTTLEDIISATGVPYTSQQLSSLIKTETVSNTGAFTITVTSTSPTEAELIANTIFLYRLLFQRYC